MSDAQRITLIGITLPRCERQCTVAPCAAVTDRKCKNTPATCLDPANYLGGTQELFYCAPTEFFPKELEAIPSLASLTSSSQRINPAENLGKRERATAVFSNHRHNDLDLDPYVDERDYIPSETGTYWGKFDAMFPNIQGAPVRIFRFSVDQWGNADYYDIIINKAQHLIAEKGELGADGRGYTMQFKDALDFSEGNKTLCPAPSEGRLKTAITNTSTSVQLEPSGVGSTYPTAFDASVGDELMVCSRVGDVVTFLQRGAFNTVAVEHEIDSTLQICETMTSKNCGQILERLLSFTDTPTDYYDTAEWAAQVASVGSPSVTVRIPTPTPVFELIQDLMRDFALDIRTDTRKKKIVMKFMVNQFPVIFLDDDLIISPSVKKLDAKRCDTYFFNFGLKNPLKPRDDASNYPNTLIKPPTDIKIILSKNPLSIKHHFSRFIPGLLRSVASQTAGYFVNRYQHAPRAMTCAVKDTISPLLGDVVNVKTRIFEDEFGFNPVIPMQVVSCTEAHGSYALELEEFKNSYDPESLVIVITLTENLINLGEFESLRDMFNSIYPNEIPNGAEIRFEADAGIVYGGAYGGGFSVVMGDWPEATALSATLKIVGLSIRGAAGVSENFTYSPRRNGQHGLYTRVPVELIDCVVAGGGGCGADIGTYYSLSPVTGVTFGRASGGSGGGYQGISGSAGGYLQDYSGWRAYAGSGGDWGEAGGDGYLVGGGNYHTLVAQGGGGTAIDGVSYVTITSTTIHGATIN